MSDGITPGDGRTPPLSAANVDARPTTSGERREYVVHATHTADGSKYPAFLVEASSAVQARAMCTRNYLELDSVEPFVPMPGEEKPPVLRYGPPASDLGRGNRAAKTGREREKVAAADDREAREEARAENRAAAVRFLTRLGIFAAFVILGIVLRMLRR